MDLVLVTGGTRGDVDPFVALGIGLRAAGYGVSVATNEDFREVVTSRGLEFRPLSGNFRAIIGSPEGREWIESGSSAGRYRKAATKVFSSWWARWMADMDAACREGERVLFHPIWCGAQYVAEKRAVPSVCISPIPILPTGHLPPLFAPGAPAWPWLRRWLWNQGQEVVGGMLLETFQEYRRSVGLAPLPGPRVGDYMVAQGVPLVHVFSRVLTDRPPDWPERTHVTGSCQLPRDPRWAPPRELEAFLAAGPPPVYVGFGSMTGRDPAELTALVVDAVTRAGVRAVVGTGWGGIDGQAFPPHVHRVDDVPHDWLFPRVAAVVHHGGIGTTTAGLRAGKATLVVPFFADQPYWGQRVEELGVGPAALPKNKLTAARLAERIGRLLAEPRYAEAARRVQASLLAEDGVARAVEVIGRYLS